MKRKTLTIEWEEYSSWSELGSDDRTLLESAVKAIEGSYAPYSHFNVGAAVLLEDGTTVPGANQENAAYPSGLCAERTAMFAASAQNPGIPMAAIAVVCSQDGELPGEPGYPCGACIQVMAQYERVARRPLRIILGGKDTVMAFTGVRSLMPFVFNNI